MGGGRYAIIDGQHRATAAKLHGAIDKVPCLILTGGPKDEARAFSAINGNVTRIHVLQSFRAKVAAGEEEAELLVDICAMAKVTIAPYPKADLVPGETMALGSVRQALKRYGQPVVVAALRFLRAAGPEAGLSAAAILGAGDAMFKHKEWRQGATKLGESLADRGGLAKLQERALKRRASYGGTEWSNFSTVMADAISVAQRAPAGNMARMMAGR